MRDGVGEQQTYLVECELGPMPSVFVIDKLKRRLIYRFAGIVRFHTEVNLDKEMG